MQSTVRLRLLPSVVVVGIALLVHHRKRGEEENQKAASALISGMEWSFIEKECRKKAFLLIPINHTLFAADLFDPEFRTWFFSLGPRRNFQTTVCH